MQNDLINKDNLQLLYEKVRALRNKKRVQILNLLHDNNGMTITELMGAIKEVQSRTSQHVGILRNAGFVYPVKQGKEKVYFVDMDAIRRYNYFEFEVAATYEMRRRINIQDELIKQMDTNINLLLKELAKWESK